MSTLEAVLERLEALRQERSALTGSRERLAELETQIARKFTEYSGLAERLGYARTAAARKLESLIEREIAVLGMKKARFGIRVTKASASLADPASIRDQGTEDVEFLIAPTPGEELRPPRRIAPGGELSRVMLALKSVGKERESAKTLIFDEIDAGIGGKTAAFIAQKLRRLAGRHQVLCVGGTATIKGAIQFPEEDCGYVHILLRETGLGFAPNVWIGRPAATDHALNWTLANKSGGQYEIRHVPAGSWEVVAFAPASERCIPFDKLPHAARSVTIAEGETKQLDLELTASSSRSTGP